MNDFDLVIGIHSIWHAINNQKRNGFQLYCSDQGLKDFRKTYPEIQKIIDKKNVAISFQEKIQEFAERFFSKNHINFQRIPGNIFLVCSKLETMDHQWLDKFCKENERVQLVALDQVSDLSNGAAILRTAAFYNLSALILSQKGSFSLTPSFFRISSGAAEYVPIIQSNNLAKTIQLLEKQKIDCIGFSEKSDQKTNTNIVSSQRLCLIHGAEESGLSYSVLRTLKHVHCLQSLGAINSLNVSVASAITMEKYFHN